MSSEKNSCTPKLRFPGFTGEWEEKLVKDLCTINTGKSNTQDQCIDGKYPFFIRSDKPVKSNRYLYDCEAVITIGDGQIGKVFHYVNGKFDLHQRCYMMSQFNRIIPRYFYYFFSHNFYDRAMRLTAKATVDSVRLEMISDMPIFFPSFKEQEKIATFLSEIDVLISAQDQKVERLKEHKKGLMQQLFPQQGETTPRLRFPGFTGEWVERKIGNSFDERTEKNREDLPLLSLGENGLALQSETDRKDNSNADKSKYLRVAIGDLAYNTMRMWQGRCVHAEIEGIVSPAYTVCKPKEGINSLFHYYFFKTQKMIQMFHQNSQGLVSDTLNLKYEAFSKIKYSLPLSPDEQQKIASCLSSLDCLISSEQSKLDVLKDHKKGLMQQLFPQPNK